MSSHASSSVRRFPEAVRQRFARWLDGALRRRGPIDPPLTLRYRQVFILPTAFGWMIALLLHGMLLGSLNFNNSMGLLTTFLLACLGLLSMHLAFRNLEGIRVEAVHVRPVFAGQAVDVHIELAEAAGRPRLGIVCRRPGSADGEGVDLEANATAVARLALATERRGRLPVGRLRIRTRQPLGLFEAWSWVDSRATVRVWPRPADRPPPPPWTAASRPSSRPGDESDEFHGLRPWREGDPVHRIAWKASQRHDQLLARQFTRPERGRIVFRLDQVPATDLEDRLSILCRWILDAERDGLRYGLELGAWQTAPDHGEPHLRRCLDALADHP
ncbi:DUF58 domain-containing protein [Halomonas denitrificans]|nr:DUF58 domain-containing protein [Halomonas denitrificans]